MKKFLLISCFVLFITRLFGQATILVPEIINFSKKMYGAGKQNRAVVQDKRGLLYFANDDGLLVFDGTYWKKYTLTNKSMVRSLAIAGDRIYTGGQHEFGYFFPDAHGNLSYQSLKNKIAPADDDFTDVWRVMSFGNDIFFQSSKRIFQLHQDSISVFKSIDWRFLGVSRGSLIAQQYENGLVEFINGKWQPLPSAFDFSKNKIIVRTVTDFTAGSILISTSRAGVFIMDHKLISKFETPAIDSISANFIHFAYATDTSQTIIGTKLGGYYIINNRGELLQHITRQQGLQTNTIHSAFADREKNIWLCTESGIDLVVNNNAISHINPSYENNSPGYSAAVYDNDLYIGTGIGLYRMAMPPSYNLAGKQGSFSFVKNSSGFIWGLSIVNNQLLMGRNSGASIVTRDGLQPLDSSNGFWSFQPLTTDQPCQMMMAATYNGINLYRYNDGHFSSTGISTIFESAKFTVMLDNDIWTAQPYQGLYRIRINSDGKLINQPYKDVRGILSGGHYHLFRIHNKIVLITGKRIFEYDKAIDDFKVSVYLTKFFPASPPSYLKEDAQGNIWFIDDKKPGVIDMAAPDNPSIIYFPELNNNVLGNDDEFIYPINKNNILISGETGFYHLDFEKYKQGNQPVQVLLRSVSIYNGKDSSLFGGYFEKNLNSETYASEKKISYGWNSVHIEFSSPYYRGAVQYSYRLKGYEQEWSGWSAKTERTYSNLPAGNYVFEVMARNNNGTVSAPAKFVFTILPPWYKTYTAYIFYVLLTIALLYWFYKRQQKKYLLAHERTLQKQEAEFKEEQKDLEYRHQLEIEHSEKEIIQLKNKKLEAEMQHHNTELASATMNLLQKKELLNKIKDEIIKAQEETQADQKTKNIRRIIKIINEQLDVSNDWERFSVYFDRVNNNFLEYLKQKHPSLTQSDLKLCAYLRLNLTTKEIADLLNMSIRGVESSRYRLRKKLDVPNEISLNDYLVKSE